MILSETIASTIISEINEIIPMKINIMNEEGTIIASSDKARVNSFHEGAYQIVKEQTSELRVNFDGEFDGALMGLNYPIKFQDYIVGVIGITGVYEDIKESSSIIKRMTELLLENIYSVEQKQIRENIYNRYLSDWINEREPINDEYLEKGKMLGFDLTIPRRLLVCTFLNDETEELVRNLQQTEEAKKMFKTQVARFHPNNIYFEKGHMLVCAIVAENDDEIVSLYHEALKSLEHKYGVRILIGVNNDNFDYCHAKKSYRQALKANQTCLRHQCSPITFYNDLHLELFTNEIDNTIKQEFIDRLFSENCTDEIDEMLEFLDVYYQCEGSINDVSERLYIHKNTTQNRLKAILECTGFDPRSLQEAFLFNVALHFYKEIKNQE